MWVGERTLWAAFCFSRPFRHVVHSDDNLFPVSYEVVSAPLSAIAPKRRRKGKQKEGKKRSFRAIMSFYDAFPYNQPKRLVVG